MRNVGRSLGLFIFALPAAAIPCLTVGQHGAAISIAEETAAIVWDADRQQETFVREAGFVTHARDFGFLVPTPSVPKLWAAGPNVYRGMSRVIAAHVKPTAGVAMKGGPGGYRGGVSVIGEQRVGKYDAAILASRDAKAVEGWLSKHGYSVESKTREWLAPYLARGWTITAFKVASDAGMGVLPPVVMSFKTDRPIYPYREPGSTPNAYGRSLRVFVVSNGPVEARLGKRHWLVEKEYSGALTPSEEVQVKADLATSRIDLPSNAWLTSYVDRSNPRRGTDDIRFVPRKSAVVNPAAIGGAAAGLGLLSAMLIWRRRSTYRSRSAVFSQTIISN